MSPARGTRRTRSRHSTADLRLFVRAVTPGGPVDRRPGVFTPAFMTLAFTSFFTYFSLQLLTASLPLYAVRLGADDAALGLLAGLIAIVSLVSRPWVGWWLDTGGTVAALTVGILLFTVSAIGYWIAASVAVLLVFRAITGVAVALFSTAGQTLTVNLAPAERRGEALSLYSIWHPIAQIFAPPLGVAVAHTLGYGALFGACTGIGLCGLGLVGRLRGQHSPAARRRPLFNHTVLLPGLWLMLLMVPYGANIGLLAVHALRRGLSNPGVVFTAMAVGLLAVLLSLGRVSDRLGRHAPAVPGLLLAAAGMWCTALFSGPALVLAGAISGLGLGLAQPALFAAAVDLASPEERGSALATMGMFLEIGIGLGAIGGGVLAQAVGLPSMFGAAGLAPGAGALLLWISSRARPLRRVESGLTVGKRQ
jgi:MFS family permease